jgi:hypothetical protein
MSYEVMAYEKARHDCRAARQELHALTGAVAEVAAALLTDRLDVDLSRWPSRERMTALFARVRAAEQELDETWAGLPEGMKSGLEPPPKGP